MLRIERIYVFGFSVADHFNRRFPVVLSLFSSLSLPSASFFVMPGNELPMIFFMKTTSFLGPLILPRGRAPPGYRLARYPHSPWWLERFGHPIEMEWQTEAELLPPLAEYNPHWREFPHDSKPWMVGRRAFDAAKAARVAARAAEAAAAKAAAVTAAAEAEAVAGAEFAVMVLVTAVGLVVDHPSPSSVASACSPSAASASSVAPSSSFPAFSAAPSSSFSASSAAPSSSFPAFSAAPSSSFPAFSAAPSSSFSASSAAPSSSFPAFSAAPSSSFSASSAAPSSSFSASSAAPSSSFPASSAAPSSSFSASSSSFWSSLPMPPRPPPAFHVAWGLVVQYPDVDFSNVKEEPIDF